MFQNFRLNKTYAAVVIFIVAVVFFALLIYIVGGKYLCTLKGLKGARLQNPTARTNDVNAPKMRGPQDHRWCYVADACRPSPGAGFVR